MEGEILMSHTNLCCAVCREDVLLDDEVDIDIINTITHKPCTSRKYLIKDSGTFAAVIDKYPFFDSTLTSLGRLLK